MVVVVLLEHDVTSLRYAILCSGKLSREKTLANFVVLWLFSEQNLGVWYFGTAKASNPQKISLQKS